MNEGYKPDYEPSGDADREVELKTGQWIRVWEIPGFFQDAEALQEIRAFRRFQRFGWPYGPWALNPAPYVDLMELLSRVDEIYHPRVVL